MAKERAEVEVKLTGTDAAVSDARKIDAQLSAIGAGVAAGTRQAAGSLLQMAGGALKAATALQGLSLANAVQESRQLDLLTARLGQTAGTSGGRLVQMFEAAERRTLTGSLAMAEFSKQLGRASYDGQFAVASVSALSDQALALGRELGDELPLGLAMQRLGVQAEALPAELGRVRTMAESLRTIGGPAALADTLAALSPQLDQVATKTDASRARLEALVGVLGKGLKPQQAQAVASQALGLVQSRALDLERLTGEQVLDERGQVIDPTRALANYQKIMRRKWGSNTAGMRRAAVTALGPMLGSLMMSTDFSQVDELARAQSTGANEQDAARFRASKEGQRIGAQLDKDRAMREAGRPFLGAGDWLNENLGVPGTMVATWLGGKGLERLGGALLSGGGSGGGGTGAGLGVSGGVGALGFALPMAAATLGAGAMQVGTLAEIGEDREKMGARWRSGHAATLGAELAQQAQQAGDLRAVIGRAGGDSEVIRETLAVLEGRLDQLNETLKRDVVAGIAAEFRRAPIRVTSPSNPNEKRGN